MLSNLKWDNFSVWKEYINVELKPLTGSIPCSLRGVYSKIGPAWRHNGDVQHALDGDGYLTRIKFHDGKAYLDGRYVTDTRYCRGPDAFGGPMLSLTPLKNKLNTSILEWNNDLIAFYEGCVPYKLSSNMSSVSIFGSYKKGLPMKGFGGVAVNAHYKKDDQGVLHILDIQYGFGFGIGTWMRWKRYKDGSDQAFEETCTYVPHFVYIHDWTMTEQDYVFILHPMSISFEDIKKGIASSLKQKKGQSVIYTVDKTTGFHHTWNVQGGDIFVTHYIQCNLDDNNGISFTAVAHSSYENIERRGSFQISLSMHKGYRNAMRMDKHTYNIEFPSPCGRFAGFGRVQHPLEGIIRLSDDKVVIYDHKQVFGEPLVIDDGKYVVFLSVQYELPIKTSLWICDALDLQVLCILAMPDPYVPLGLHGIWSDKI